MQPKEHWRVSGHILGCWSISRIWADLGGCREHASLSFLKHHLSCLTGLCPTKSRFFGSSMVPEDDRKRLRLDMWIPRIWLSFPAYYPYNATYDSNHNIKYDWIIYDTICCVGIYKWHCRVIYQGIWSLATDPSSLKLQASLQLRPDTSPRQTPHGRPRAFVKIKRIYGYEPVCKIYPR